MCLLQSGSLRAQMLLVKGVDYCRHTRMFEVFGTDLLVYNCIPFLHFSIVIIVILCKQSIMTLFS